MPELQEIVFLVSKFPREKCSKTPYIMCSFALMSHDPDIGRTSKPKAHSPILSMKTQI